MSAPFEVPLLLQVVKDTCDDEYIVCRGPHSDVGRIIWATGMEWGALQGRDIYTGEQIDTAGDRSIHYSRVEEYKDTMDPELRTKCYRPSNGCLTNGLYNQQESSSLGFTNERWFRVPNENPMGKPIETKQQEETVSQDFEKWKKDYYENLIRVVKEYKKEHDWCGEVEDILARIDPALERQFDGENTRNYTVTIVLDVEVSGEEFRYEDEDIDSAASKVAIDLSGAVAGRDATLTITSRRVEVEQ